MVYLKNDDHKYRTKRFLIIQNIFGKCSSLEHVFLPDGFKKFVSAILGTKKKTDKRGPLNPLSPKIDIQILQTDLYTFPLRIS